MECPNCRAEVREDARFCGTCGQALAVPRCPNCQAPIKPAHRFCAKCGHVVQGDIPTTPSERVGPAEPSLPTGAGAQPARKRAGLWVLLTLMLLALAAAAVWAATQGGLLAGDASVTPPAETSIPVAASSDAEMLWADAQAAAEAGDTPGAVALLQSLHSQSPDFHTAEVRQQLLAGCRSWHEQAAAQADRDVLDALSCLADVSPGDPGLAQRVSWQNYFDAEDLLLSGQASRAIELLQPLQGSDFAAGRPRDLLYEAYLQQGDAACAAQDYDGGRDWYLRARSLDPTRMDAGNRLVDCAAPTATPTATPLPTATPTSLPPGAMTGRYDQEGHLNLRAGPGFNYPVVSMVEAGAEFTITVRTEDAEWLEARDDSGATVWVYSEVLNLNYLPQAAQIASSTPAPPAEFTVADSVADFGLKQGEKNWFYVASQSPGSLEFEQIPLDGGWYRWTTGGRSPEMRLSAQGSYPSWNSDAMRVWVSSYQGTLSIEGRAHKEQGAGYGGNGVDLRIVLRRPKSDQEDGFERELWRASLGPYDTDGLAFEVDPFTVEQRDQIYFVTSARGDDQEDNTVFTSRVILVNEGGVELTPTPTPTPIPPPTAVPPLCFEPRLRHFEEHRGCCGEVVGVAYTNEGRLSFGNIHIEGPPATQQYKRDFVINQDGGYEITALTAFPADSIYYTTWLTGPRIKSEKFVVRFEDAGRIRAVVDWYQVSCN
jgi:hypothetical protein